MTFFLYFTRLRFFFSRANSVFKQDDSRYLKQGNSVSKATASTTPSTPSFPSSAFKTMRGGPSLSAAGSLFQFGDGGAPLPARDRGQLKSLQRVQERLESSEPNPEAASSASEAGRRRSGREEEAFSVVVSAVAVVSAASVADAFATAAALLREGYGATLRPSHASITGGAAERTYTSHPRVIAWSLTWCAAR